MITINSRKYDGTIKRSWRAEFLEQRDSLLVFVGEFDAVIDHPDLGFIEKGTLSYEYYWLDRWYNVFRFHEPSGELKSYYFNINMPPHFSAGVLDYVDLDIDILVLPDHSYRVLDQEDYEKSAAAFGYPPDLTTRVGETLIELLRSIRMRDVPGVPELFAT
jgi:protein associated with RNAse G/E